MISTQNIEQILLTKDKSETCPSLPVRQAGGRRAAGGSDIRKVAKEMEALFVFELIKVMRETTEGMSSDSKGLGSETYMGLFDMEVSRVMADKGLGIQDAIVNWFERSRPNNKINDNDNKK